jgi:hypothetical protein
MPENYTEAAKEPVTQDSGQFLGFSPAKTSGYCSLPECWHSLLRTDLRYANVQ